MSILYLNLLLQKSIILTFVASMKLTIVTRETSLQQVTDQTSLARATSLVPTIPKIETTTTIAKTGLEMRICPLPTIMFKLTPEVKMLRPAKLSRYSSILCQTRHFAAFGAAIEVWDHFAAFAAFREAKENKSYIDSKL